MGRLNRVVAGFVERTTQLTALAINVNIYVTLQLGNDLLSAAVSRTVAYHAGR